MRENQQDATIRCLLSTSVGNTITRFVTWQPSFSTHKSLQGEVKSEASAVRVAHRGIIPSHPPHPGRPLKGTTSWTGRLILSPSEVRRMTVRTLWSLPSCRSSTIALLQMCRGRKYSWIRTTSPSRMSRRFRGFRTTWKFLNWSRYSFCQRFQKSLESFKFNQNSWRNPFSFRAPVLLGWWQGLLLLISVLEWEHPNPRYLGWGLSSQRPHCRSAWCWVAPPWGSIARELYEDSVLPYPLSAPTSLPTMPLVVQ